MTDHLGDPGAAGKDLRGTGTPCSIDITMSATTVKALQGQNCRLYVFKAVQSLLMGGAPVVWAATSNYSLNTRINWTDQYYGLVSDRPVMRGMRLSGNGSQEVGLGQTFIIVDQNRAWVRRDGDPGLITAQNDSSTEVTFGLAQPDPVDGRQPSPICAFSLYARIRELVVPLRKVALAFAPASPDYFPGTVVTSSPGRAVLVDLTGTGSAALGYDVDNHWSWTGDTASDIPAADFTRTLIAPLRP